MISLADYWMGRDKAYPKDLTPEIQANAAKTVERANQLLLAYQKAHPDAAARHVNSGWRPPAVNAGVKGAAAKSKHMLGLAVDLSDDDGRLDQWCMTPQGQAALTAIGLWLEHPSATPRWCHVQTVPPRSGNRVFMP